MPETIVRPAQADAPSDGVGPTPTPGPSVTPSAADVIAQALRTIDIAQIGAVSGTAGSLGIDRIELGEATIDRLVVQGISASIQAGTTLLQDVRFVLELRLSVDWWYDFGWLGSGGDTVTLPSLSFGLPLGNVLVPSLQDINLVVPSATVNNAEASIAPITNLNLGGARFRDFQMDDTQLPSAGFGLSGMSLGAVTVDNVGFPAAASRRLGIGEFAPDGPLRLPSAEVTGIEIPSAQIPSVVSQGAVDIDNAQATRRGVSLSLGLFGFTFWVHPVFDIHIGQLTLTDVTAAASIERLRLEDVSAPMTIRGVNLGDLQLEQLTVNQVSI
jgi:hypothetical protein